jgi:hypothetical protein
MSTLKSVEVWIDDLQHDKAITVAAKDYPPVVDAATSMKRLNSGIDVSIDQSIPIITRLSSEVPIQGKMISVEMRLNDSQVIQMDDLELKNRLITKLVRELMDGKCIEFTKQQDVAGMETIVRARIFVTPDDQVRIVRKETNLG